MNAENQANLPVYASQIRTCILDIGSFQGGIDWTSTKSFVVHLAEGVRQVNHVYVRGVDLGRVKRAVDDFGGQVGEIVAFAGEIAREVTLIAAEDPDVGSAHDAHVTTTKRVTGRFRAWETAPPARV